MKILLLPLAEYVLIIQYQLYLSLVDYINSIYDYLKYKSDKLTIYLRYIEYHHHSETEGMIIVNSIIT